MGEYVSKKNFQTCLSRTKQYIDDKVSSSVSSKTKLFNIRIPVGNGRNRIGDQESWSVTKREIGEYLPSGYKVCILDITISGVSGTDNMEYAYTFIHAVFDTYITVTEKLIDRNGTVLGIATLQGIGDVSDPDAEFSITMNAEALKDKTAGFGVMVMAVGLYENN